MERLFICAPVPARIRVGRGLILLLLFAAWQSLPATGVAIPDAGLRAAVESALGKAENAPILDTELATLRQLQAANRGIISLEGLEAATGLETLILRNNAIHDLGPLQSLTRLERLEIDANEITDLSGLRSLMQLRFLFAHQNAIEDLEPLSALTALEDLVLFDNAIGDLSALAGLTALKRLNLSLNALLEVEALAPLIHLEVLFLADNQISDVHSLRSLRDLRQLDLSGNRLTDLEPLHSLAALESVDLRDNHLNDHPVVWAPLLQNNPSLILYLSPQRAQRSYADWLTEWGIPPEHADPTNSLPEAGQPNLLLFSMGTGPEFAPSQTVTVQTASPPSATRLRFQRDLTAGGIVRIIESSPNLRDWAPAEVEQISLLDEPVPYVQQVEATIRLEEPNRFLRLHIRSLP